MLGEVTKPKLFAFKRRGIDKSEMSKEMLWFFEQCKKLGMAAAGGIRWRSDVLYYVQQNGGVVAQLLRNPLHIVGYRMFRKPRAADVVWRRTHDEGPKDDLEVFEGHVQYYADDHLGKMIRLVDQKQWPIIRVEDLNRSMRTGDNHFKKVMEWLTKTEWPENYIEHIRTHFLPFQLYLHSIEWDEEGRPMPPVHTIVDVNRRRSSSKEGWDKRPGWEEDPSPLVLWESWNEAQQEIYLKHFAEIQRVLGYNQAYIGSLDTYAGDSF